MALSLTPQRKCCRFVRMRGLRICDWENGLMSAGYIEQIAEGLEHRNLWRRVFPQSSASFTSFLDCRARSGVAGGVDHTRHRTFRKRERYCGRWCYPQSPLQPLVGYLRTHKMLLSVWARGRVWAQRQTDSTHIVTAMSKSSQVTGMPNKTRAL